MLTLPSPVVSQRGAETCPRDPDACQHESAAQCRPSTPSMSSASGLSASRPACRPGPTATLSSPWPRVGKEGLYTRAGGSAAWIGSIMTSAMPSGLRSVRHGVINAHTAGRPGSRCSATVCWRSRGVAATRSRTSPQPVEHATPASRMTRSRPGCDASATTRPPFFFATARSRRSCGNGSRPSIDQVFDNLGNGIWIGGAIGVGHATLEATSASAFNARLLSALRFGGFHFDR